MTAADRGKHALADASARREAQRIKDGHTTDLKDEMAVSMKNYKKAVEADPQVKEAKERLRKTKVINKGRASKRNSSATSKPTTTRQLRSNVQEEEKEEEDADMIDGQEIKFRD